jgi:hypothetical protein
VGLRIRVSSERPGGAGADGPTVDPLSSTLGPMSLPPPLPPTDSEVRQALSERDVVRAVRAE